MSDDDFRIEEGSGNVFADLALPNPDERLIKANLAIQIKEAIGAGHLTQAKAAALLDIDQRAALDELARLGQELGIGYK